MNLRPIEAKDLDEIIEVRTMTRENAFSREALAQLGITAASVANLLDTTHRGWLCEADGKIAGFAIGDGKTGELWVIAVRPEFEGRRIGSSLLSAVERWLRSRGWDEFWLWTSADQKKRAFGFYLRHGWTLSEAKGDIVYMRKKSSLGPGLHVKGSGR